jgi:hypothetical protein
MSRSSAPKVSDLVAGDITNLFEHWDAETLKVSAPLKRVFVCGGTTDSNKAHALMRRDAFMSICCVGDLGKYTFIRAEDVETFAPRGNYDDVFTFEMDVAQIAHIVLLFSESAGSFSELGSFCVHEDIAQRLLVVIDDRQYEQDSFIRHGPLKFLETKFPKSAVLVVKTDEIGQKSGSFQTDIDKTAFGAIILSALKKRMRDARDDQTFNPKKSGHMIKFITGLIQDYGALKAEEISSILGCVGFPISEKELLQYAQCAEAMDWIKKDRRNLETYYTATSRTEALRFKFVDNKVIDRSRWRLDVLTYWKKEEPERFSSIQANRSES